MKTYQKVFSSVLLYIKLFTVRDVQQIINACLSPVLHTKAQNIKISNSPFQTAEAINLSYNTNKLFSTSGALNNIQYVSLLKKKYLIIFIKLAKFITYKLKTY